MIKLARFTAIASLTLGLLFVAGTAQAQNRPPIVEQLAKTYGFDSYSQIDALRYAFNIDVPGLFKVSRTWTWEPKTGAVTYESTDKEGKPVKVSYNRNQLNSAPANVKEEIEPAFVNDNYWFMFPFHVYWDKSANVEDKGMQKLPIGKGTAKLIEVKYGAELGGYTPGDTWDLYLGTDGRVAQFIYHRGGPKKPSNVTTTWAGYKMAGPLLVATDHRGTVDGKPARVFFTDVAVKTNGSSTWTDAK
jgi:hypothetical protein